MSEVTGALLKATEKLDAIRALHTEYKNLDQHRHYCNGCYENWPCATIEILERP